MENYISDKTVSKQSQDEFQRYDFAKRIANTISNRTSTENIVFGLYGKWGSGKSSMLKFIEKELDEEKTLQVHFNPWRYKDEDDLLIMFFQTIANTLDKNIYNGWNKFSKLVNRFGGFTKLVNIDNKDISNAISTNNIEKFKKRAEKYLSESQKKLVVFIDDIDRLDKDELFTLFRLVKLTADFSNTVYILSFDKEMVAKAIGQRFGSGDHNDGSNFLEKIIQIPIELPDFRYNELRSYTLEMIQEVLNKNSIDLSDSEKNRFVTAFDNCLFDKINTPRNTIRYRNTIDFSVPLLKGEVNIVDFLVFEGLKLFYPPYIDYFKLNEEVFISGIIRNGFLDFDIPQLNEETKKEFNHLAIHYGENIHNGISTVLQNLFPKFSILFYKREISDSELNEQKREKRISSADYYERYLTYSLAKDEISDVDFTIFIKELVDLNNDEVILKIKAFVANSTITHFLDKVHLVERTLNWESSSKIITFIFNYSNSLKQDDSTLAGFNSSFRQAISFCTRQFNKSADSIRISRFLTDNIGNIENIEFLLDFLSLAVYNKGINEDYLTENQVKEIYKVAIESILSTLAKSENLFEELPDLSRRIIFYWKIFDTKNASKYLKEYLKSNDEAYLIVLKSFAGYRYVTSSVIDNKATSDSSYAKKYLSDFDDKSFEYLKTLNSHKIVFKIIQRLHPIDSNKENEFALNTRRSGHNSDDNLIDQFLHYYNESLNKGL